MIFALIKLKNKTKTTKLFLLMTCEDERTYENDDQITKKKVNALQLRKITKK